MRKVFCVSCGEENSRVFLPHGFSICTRCKNNKFFCGTYQDFLVRLYKRDARKSLSLKLLNDGMDINFN